MQGSVEDTPTPQELANDSSTKTAPVVRVREEGTRLRTQIPTPTPSQGKGSAPELGAFPPWELLAPKTSGLGYITLRSSVSLL